MKKFLPVLGVVALLLLLSASLASAASGGVNDSPELKQMAEVRQATAKYHDVSVAEADGYVSTEECVEVPGLGGMGIHYVNWGLLQDESIDHLAPEILLYVPTDDGLRLVAVEYVMVAFTDVGSGPQPWFDTDLPPGGWITSNPVLFEQMFNGPMPGHGPGEPWHSELHVWLWQGNPQGVFADFNPHVSCS